MASKVMSEKVHAVLSALERRQGRRRRPPPTDVLSEMIDIVIRSLSNGRLSRTAVKNLKKEFVDWNEVRVARVLEVVNAMRMPVDGTPIARRIIGLLSAVFNDRGSLDLDPLAQASTAEIKQFLAGLEPLGRDLVPVVMLLAMNQNVMPVDEAVIRVHKRYGISPPGATAAQIRRTLEEALPGDELYRYYMAVRHLAERSCLHDAPACQSCPTRRDCRWRQKNPPAAKAPES
jgi:endonuclease III